MFAQIRRAIRRPSVHRPRDSRDSYERASAPARDSLARRSGPSDRRVLSVRCCEPSIGLHRSAFRSGLHPASPAGARIAHSSSGARPVRGPRSLRSPHCSALRIGAVHLPRSPPLLRPLLTARSIAPPADAASPFQASGEISPGKIHRLSLHERRIYDVTPWSPELRDQMPARPDATSPLIRFLFVTPQVSLPASFSTPLTAGALRFTRVVATNFPEDFHLQVDYHAGHTLR